MQTTQIQSVYCGFRRRQTEVHLGQIQHISRQPNLKSIKGHAVVEHKGKWLKVHGWVSQGSSEGTQNKEPKRNMSQKVWYVEQTMVHRIHSFKWLCRGSQEMLVFRCRLLNWQQLVVPPFWTRKDVKSLHCDFSINAVISAVTSWSRICQNPETCEVWTFFLCVCVCTHREDILAGPHNSEGLFQALDLVLMLMWE